MTTFVSTPELRDAYEHSCLWKLQISFDDAIASPDTLALLRASVARRHWITQQLSRRAVGRHIEQTLNNTQEAR